MYKRILTLAVFGLLAVFVYHQTQQLFLSFYILFPALLFPTAYFHHAGERLYFWSILAAAAALYLFFFWQHPAFEMGLFGVGIVIFLVALGALNFFWESRLGETCLEMEESRRELGALKEKYQVRVENLSRLEKQVLSLMEVFEIARDFSGALKTEVLCKLIYEKVMPELPFKKMKFFVTTEDSDVMMARGFLITAAGVVEESVELSARDKSVFQQAFERATLLKLVPEGLETERWIFPLMIEGKAAGIVDVRGADTEDLVKFEVLASQLVLQVRKIRLYETVLRLSIIDGLTGVYVRRYFLERMGEELKRSIKFGLPLSVLMLDIDHFKRYNDEFGHPAGDEALKKVATLIRRSLRKVDIVARYGGEEFVAVLPESRADKALEVAERIRSGIARHDFKIYDHHTKVTVSIGVATFPEDVFKETPPAFYDDLAFDLIRHADKALYRAKEEGRNRIYIYRDLSVKGV